MPLLQAAPTYLQSGASLNTGRSWLSTNSAWFSILSGIFAIITLSYNDVMHSALSTIAVFVQFLVYASLLPCNSRQFQFLPHVHDFGQAIVPLSKRTILAIVVAISLQTMLFGFPWDGIALTLLLAFFKALSWYYIAHTVCIFAN